MSLQNKKPTLSAEKLYRQFKRHRQDSANHTVLSQTPDLSAVPADGTLRNTASELYMGFKSTRRENKTDAVNDIMRAIKQAASDMEGAALPGNADALEEQPLPGSDATVSVNAVSGRQAKFSIQPSVLVPAIAAVLVCLFIIPLWLNPGQQISSPVPSELANALPAELVEQAPEAVAFVSSDNSVAYGFSATGTQAQSAFQSGVLATDLWILASSNNNELLQQYVRNTDASQWSGVETAFARYTDSIGTEDPAGQGVQLRALLAAIAKRAAASGQSDWFAIGQSVQSIYLASEHALTTSDYSALSSAFSLGAGLTIPSGDAPATRSVTTLFSDDYVMPMASVELRWIIKTTENIKLLMH